MHRGMSQRLLARMIKVAVGTIQNYEHGRAHLTAERFEQLALALKCEPAELLKPPGSALPQYRFWGSRTHLRADKQRQDALDHLQAIWDQMRAELLEGRGIDIGDQPARDWIDAIKERMGRDVSPRAAHAAYARIRERVEWYHDFKLATEGK